MVFLTNIEIQVALKNWLLQKNIPARDPKQCVVWILKGKVERTQNHQWLQTSRTRATESMMFIQGGLWKKIYQARFCKFPS